MKLGYYVPTGVTLDLANGQRHSYVADLLVLERGDEVPGDQPGDYTIRALVQIVQPGGHVTGSMRIECGPRWWKQIDSPLRGQLQFGELRPWKPTDHNVKSLAELAESTGRAVDSGSASPARPVR